MAKESCCSTNEACPCTGVGLVRFVQAGILCVLARGDKHGYQLGEELGKLPSFAGQKPDPGGLYRTLRSLSERGMCKSQWNTDSLGPAKRIYQITPAGRKCLESWIVTLREYRESIDQLMDACEQARKLKPIAAKRTPRKPCCATSC